MDEQLAGGERALGGIEPCLEGVMDPVLLDAQLERDRPAGESQHCHSEVATLGSPRADLAVEPLRLRARGDRGSAGALPPGGFDPEHLCE